VAARRLSGRNGSGEFGCAGNVGQHLGPAPLKLAWQEPAIRTRRLDVAEMGHRGIPPGDGAVRKGLDFPDLLIRRRAERDRSPELLTGRLKSGCEPVELRCRFVAIGLDIDPEVQGLELGRLQRATEADPSRPEFRVHADSSIGQPHRKLVLGGRAPGGDQEPEFPCVGGGVQEDVRRRGHAVSPCQKRLAADNATARTGK
jgi:hypothetical protein